MLSYISIIVTFNRKKALREALIRQFKQTIQAKKIIIVDNHSTDRTYEYIQDILAENNHQLEYIRLNENFGGSGGFYFGMKEALKYNTDLIAISDDDASYREDYFEKIIETAEKNPKDMAFCGAIYENGKLNPKTASFLINENTFKCKTASFSNYQNGDFYANIWPFIGSVFRPELIKKVGLPNKEFFIWYDDFEYSIRMSQLGFKYHVVVDARIDLNTEVKPKRIPLWKVYYGFRNKIYTIQKYGKNKFVTSIFPLFMLIKKYVAIILKKDEYSHRKRKAFCIVTKAYVDGKKKSLGKVIDPQRFNQ